MDRWTFCSATQDACQKQESKKINRQIVVILVYYKDSKLR